MKRVLLGLTLSTLVAGNAFSAGQTSTLLSSASNPSIYNKALTLTAAVIGMTPTGTVSFEDGVTPITGCTGLALAGGSAQCQTAILALGTRSIVAKYSGDAQNLASTSLPFEQRVYALLDVDANGKTEALSDGLLMIRYMYGLRGAPLINSVVGLGATRTTAGEIETYIAAVLVDLDLDGNTQYGPFTDGVMLIRYLFGLRGPSVTQGAIGAGATRSSEDIDGYVQGLGYPSLTVPIDSAGGTVVLPGFAKVIFPPGTFPAPTIVRLIITGTQETARDFDFTSRIFGAGARTPFELRIEPAQQPAGDVEVVLDVPMATSPMRLFGQLLERGGQGVLDSFEIMPTVFDAAAKTVKATVPRAVFTDQRAADSKWEAVVVAAALPLVAGTPTDHPVACQGGGLVRPMEGVLTVSSPFSPLTNPGTDFAATNGRPVLSMDAGVVEFIMVDNRSLPKPDPKSGTNKGYGLFMVVRHDDGSRSLYANLLLTMAIVGQEVRAGQPIAQAGSSGGTNSAHLHVEYVPNGLIYASAGKVSPVECFVFTTELLALSNPRPTWVNQTVRLEADVTPVANQQVPQGFVPTGDVTFTENGAFLCKGALSAGKASCEASFFSTGYHTVLARYPGDARFGKSHNTYAVLTNPTGSFVSVELKPSDGFIFVILHLRNLEQKSYKYRMDYRVTENGNVTEDYYDLPGTMLIGPSSGPPNDQRYQFGGYGTRNARFQQTVRLELPEGIVTFSTDFTVP